jgi:hypothetical protein
MAGENVLRKTLTPRAVEKILADVYTVEAPRPCSAGTSAA